ncbi:hypothetical protein [Microbacterium suwonense]|uniref:DUF4352 domain-containing protein n=1 Tax=Microbacterium suwonense TaxID=683047 RepID=A0ABM8FXT4_9MICO|nr:hypothetical protein [Microbacterium suwonense]BDZ40405.1 hypothetical protein GCM10025863_30190 [Microbacterium suwonense]
MTVPTPPASAVAAGADAPHRPGWWRTNRLALIALVLLAPAVGLGVGANEWYSYFGYGMRKVTPVVVPDQGTVELSGAAWGPVRSGEIADTSGMDMPEGTRLLAAIVPVAPEGRAVSCEPPVLVQQSTGREWTPMRSEIGIPYNSDEPERCISSLADEDDPESAQPYSLTVAFVVPSDVEGPFWLEVDPVGDGRFVRFSIDP